MHVERHSIAIATDGSGDSTSYTAEVLTGRIIDVQYVAGSAALDNTADFTITGETSTKTILVKANVSAAFVAAPRQATYLNTDASAALYAAAGTAVLDHICIAKERVKLVVAQGGASKNGTVYITVA